jgi:hypothetical protein
VAVGSGLYFIVLALQSRAGYPIDSLRGRYGSEEDISERLLSAADSTDRRNTLAHLVSLLKYLVQIGPYVRLV